MDRFDWRERIDAPNNPLAAFEALKDVAFRRAYRERVEAMGTAAGVRQLTARNQAALDAAFDVFQFQKDWLAGGRAEALKAWGARRREVRAAFAARLGQIKRGEAKP